MGPNSRRLLSQSAQRRVTLSIAKAVSHDRGRQITPALYRPLMVWARALTCGIYADAPLAQTSSGSRISLMEQFDLPMSGDASSGRAHRPEALPDDIVDVR
jgi:hypothetical protein